MRGCQAAPRRALQHNRKIMKLKHFLGCALVALAATLMCACSNDNGTQYALDTRYLPVKLVKSSKWSIVDLKTGELVAKDAYDYEPSSVVEDMYFVPNKNGTFSYYNIADPKKPVGGEWGSTTIFSSDGVAVASRRGGALCVIDRNCNVVKELPKTVTTCSMFSRGRAIFRNEENKAGYIDVKGDTVIPAQFDNAMSFLHGDAAVVTRTMADSAYDITAIDRSGKELFSVSSTDYKLLMPYFGMGVLPLQRGDSVVFLNRAGKEVPNPEKGSEALEKQKYQDVSFTPGLNYIVMRNNKCGVVDKDNNVIIPLKYDRISDIAKDRFLVLSDSVYTILDGKNQPVGNVKFTDFQAGPTDIFAIPGFIDTDIVAGSMLQMIGSDYAAGARKGCTLMDMNRLVGNDPRQYLGMATLAHSEGAYVILYFFNDYLAKQASPTAAPEFNYGAKLLGVSISTNLAQTAPGTEEEIVSKISANLGTVGLVYEGNNIFESETSGTAVSVGYKGGMVSLYYYMDKAMAQSLPREPRK